MQPLRSWRTTSLAAFGRCGGAACPSPPASATAQDYERPPSYTPAAALGAAARGPNYVVLSPVDLHVGLFRRYTVRTSLRRLQNDRRPVDARAHQGAQCAQCVRKKTNAAQKFGEAAVKAGLSPVIFAGNLIAHPGGHDPEYDRRGRTVRQRRRGSGFNNMGKSRDDAVASITGASKQKREIATQLGVDPYTDFKPLRQQADNLYPAGRRSPISPSPARSS